MTSKIGQAQIIYTFSLYSNDYFTLKLESKYSSNGRL